MSSNFRRPLNGFRTSAGAYINGRWLEGTREEITVVASVQPATGEDMQKLPENRRSGSIFALFTDQELHTVDTTKQTNPDIVVLSDGEYEVVHVEPWQNAVINHYRVLVARVAKRPPAGAPPGAGLHMTEGPVLA